ncbi:hypothetical protein BIW11_02355 [Tropilaelaps mercedesae]|uniref:Uncharacterized protein n=1 Tax=Tropilaelaps mercedesae TaxID=418985 RepID=A0A1V9WYU7_9ACAR|nr:hypothetical protein BIW11_02355 [Tropilaelaps mercedesae]
MAFYPLVALSGVVAASFGGFVPAHTNVATSNVLGQTYAVVPSTTTFSKTVSYGAGPSATVYGAAPAIHKTISNYVVPSVSKTISYAAAAPMAPLETTVVAPATIQKTISYRTAPVQTVVAQAPAKSALHHIYLGSRQRDVRIEEYRRPEQLIRIQEAPQQPSEVVSFAAPTDQQATVRVINHAAPAPRVEHIVALQKGHQVYNVQKPPSPAARLINITRGPAPPAKVELINEGEDQVAEITLVDTSNRPYVEYTGEVSINSAPVTAKTTSYASPAATTVVAAPATQKTVSYVEPVTTTVFGAPTVHKTLSYAAPAVQKTISYAAPAVQKTISFAAPAATTVVAAPTIKKTISYAAPATTTVVGDPAIHNTILYAAPGVHKTISYTAPGVQKTISYAAPDVQKTISYAAPAATTIVAAPTIQKTISYAAPTTTTVIGAPAVHKTISYRAPSVQKTTSYAKPSLITLPKGVSYDTSLYGNTYKTTSDDFRRAARSL